MQQYVVGFLFDDHAKTVLLIEKQRPEWQKGKLNGIGGKIENGESPRDAMAREFREETGVQQGNWQHFATLGDDQGNRFRVYFYFSFSTKTVSEAASTTDEKLVLVSLDKLTHKPIVPNLEWLIPMALSMRRQDKVDVFNILEVYKHQYAMLLTDVHLLEQKNLPDELLQTNLLNALTVKQLEGLKEQGIDPDKIIYQTHVTGMDWKQQLIQDIPYSYLVVKNEDAHGGCIVYGWSDRGWYANPTLRWLVKHLITKNMEVAG